MPKNSTPFTIVISGKSDNLGCNKYAIVGMYSDSNSRFVRHVALVRDAAELNAESRVEVFEVMPPIIAGDLTRRNAGAASDKRSFHLVADLALDDDEVASIETWLAGVDKENRDHPTGMFQQYHILPHAIWVYGENGRAERRRFSCVGFIVEAYESADIILIDSSDLPEVPVANLKLIYSDLFRIDDNPRCWKIYRYKGRKDLGLEGEGPWRVMLPGYVFHATKRANKENARPNPFKPDSSANAEFP